MWAETATGYITSDKAEIKAFMQLQGQGNGENENGDKKKSKEQVKGGRAASNLPGSGFRKRDDSYERFKTGDARGVDNADADFISEIGMGFTPAGTALDFYTFLTGEEYFTGHEVQWGWRVFGLFPMISELRKGSRLVSLVKQDTKLLKLARETFEGNDLLRREANGLLGQMANGNMNPGIGSKSIGNGIHEARSKGGARVYFRSTGGVVEVLGYSNKQNQQVVINRLFEVYK
jgi:hypothetical protein